MAQTGRKDFYAVLGVTEKAAPEEIKRAYRKLAKANHPDATGGDKKKESRFKEITEAYETLGDAKRRQEYDDIRRNVFAGAPGGGFPRGGPPPGGGGGRVRVDLNDLFAGRGRPGQEMPQDSFGDIFRDLFAGMGQGGPGGGREVHVEEPPPKSADVRMRVEVELETVARGGEQPVVRPQGKVMVRIPIGVDDGQSLRVPGRGEPGRGGRAPGDLVIEVHVKPHAIFRRKGSDLEADVTLPLDVALLGGKVEVPTLSDGKLSLSIPAGTSSGVKMRLKGKGLPKPAGGHGDLYAVTQIHLPKELPERAKALVTELATLLQAPAK